MKTQFNAGQRLPGSPGGGAIAFARLALSTPRLARAHVERVPEEASVAGRFVRRRPRIREASFAGENGGKPPHSTLRDDTAMRFTRLSAGFCVNETRSDSLLNREFGAG